MTSLIRSLACLFGFHSIVQHPHHGWISWCDHCERFFYDFDRMVG